MHCSLGYCSKHGTSADQAVDEAAWTHPAAVRRRDRRAPRHHRRLGEGSEQADGAVIAELRAERKRIPNASGLLFTIDGQPIPKNLFEYWFRAACKKAGIKNFRFHDLRHCAISRWAAANIPTAAAMLAAGHKSVASHKKYQNLQKAELKNAFQTLSRNCPEENQQEKEKAATA